MLREYIGTFTYCLLLLYTHDRRRQTRLLRLLNQPVYRHYRMDLASLGVSLEHLVRLYIVVQDVSHVYMYTYIYIEREREKKNYSCMSF